LAGTGNDQVSLVSISVQHADPLNHDYVRFLHTHLVPPSKKWYSTYKEYIGEAKRAIHATWFGGRLVLIMAARRVTVHSLICTFHSTP